MLRCYAVRTIVPETRARTGAAAIRGYRNARSSNPYPTQDQQSSDSTTRSLSHVSPRSGAVSMGSKPDVTKARAGMWQTARRAAPRLLSVDSAALLERLLLSGTTSKLRHVDNAKPRTPSNRRSPSSAHTTLKRSVPPPLIPYWGKPYLAEKLLIKYKTPDVAFQALNVLYDHAKTTSWDRQGWLARNNWQNADEIFKEISCQTEDYVFYRFLGGKLHEAAYERAQGATKLITLDTLRRYTSGLSVDVKMRPFLEQSRFFDWLAWTVTSSPYSGLRALGPQLRVLSGETHLIVKNLARFRAIVSSPDSYEKRYEMAKRRLAGECEDLHRSTSELWAVLAEFFNLLKAANTYDNRRPFYTFNATLKSFKREAIGITDDLFMIGMRRHGSKRCCRENTFNALHHHIKLLGGSLRQSVRSIQRSYYDICFDAVNRSRISSRFIPVLAHKGSIRRLLNDLLLNNRRMVNIYYESLLHFWMRHVELMSPSELERQDRVAQRHWLAQLRSDDTHVSREIELNNLYLPIRRSRQKLAHFPGWSRDSASPGAWSSSRYRVTIHEEAIKAIERLEQISPSQSQNNSQVLRRLLNLDGKSTSSSKGVPLRSKPPSTTRGRKTRGQSPERHPENFGSRSLSLLHPEHKQRGRRAAGASHSRK
ncbi:uncharacterized protein EKO05_0011239 [Ascochyta rabiei]|uniref:Uncharacterized protein n=1 Tax=Didymella rabiei TaxID=5454 RepID=A0A163E5G3_DIDRA|nr:uncharacterized protein EKO05_0011239 [Ascochyta rabiei]KZM23529.1 hypothetical protein ST47_g5322 [Ascochyta rabiei]UPX21033.1 hypothetical protein EKO05_0011239 [Ascochyta rabiei]